jgi:hypoxanthine phosphoribosyltransferase
MCEKIVYKFKDEFAVAVGKYRQKGDKNELDMIAMRWLINPEKDVENNAELAKKGFPFNSDMEPVWLTVPVELVKPLKEFFKKLQEPYSVLS